MKEETINKCCDVMDRKVIPVALKILMVALIAVIPGSCIAVAVYQVIKHIKKGA